MKNKNILKKVIICFIIIVIFVISVCFLLKTFVYPLKHFDIIKKESAKNNIDPYLVLAIIKIESGFNEKVTSVKEAKGLMQIIDSTAEEMTQNSNIDLSQDNIYDENINIALGCKYLSTLINRYNGNYYLAIVAYNAGMGNLDNWIKEGKVSENLDNITDNKIPYPETKKYLKKVVLSYKMYRILYN